MYIYIYIYKYTYITNLRKYNKSLFADIRLEGLFLDVLFLSFKSKIDPSLSAFPARCHQKRASKNCHLSIVLYVKGLNHFKIMINPLNTY